jgi:hypothetical protein
MSKYGKIAERLAKRRATFAALRAQPKGTIDILWETFLRYPTVTLLCLLPVSALLGFAVIAVLVAT